MPNKKLEQMYTAMVEARMLEEHIAETAAQDESTAAAGSTRGQEACRVSTAIELGRETS